MATALGVSIGKELRPVPAVRRRRVGRVAAVAAGLFVALALHASGAELDSDLAPTLGMPASVNQLGFTATLVEYNLSLAGVTYIRPESAISTTYDTNSGVLTVRSIHFVASDVILLGIPLTGIEVRSAAPASAPVNPSTGAVSVSLRLRLSITALGYSAEVEAPVTLTGRLEVNGSLPNGPTTFRLSGASPVTFEGPFYIPIFGMVTIRVAGTLAHDFTSTEPAYPNGKVEGVVEVDAPGGSTPVDGAIVGNLGYEGTSRPDGKFAFPEWPDRPDPTWLYAGLACGDGFLMGASDRVPLSPSGRTDLGVVVLRGEPGHFGAPQSVATGPGATFSIARARLDRDAYDDLAVALHHPGGTDTIRVLFGNASGGLTLGPELATGAMLGGEVAAGDGFQEPLIYYPDATHDAISVFFGWGNGSGQFAGPVSIAAGGTPTAVRLVNLGNPLGPDVVVALSGTPTGTGRVVRLPAVALGQYGSPVEIYSTAGDVRAIEVGRINGDAFDDVVVANYDLGSCNVLLSTSAVAFETSQPVPCGMHPRSFLWQDLDGDGREDFAVAGDADTSGAGRVTVLASQSGTLTPMSVDVGTDLGQVAGAGWVSSARHSFIAASRGDASVRILSGDPAAGYTLGQRLAAPSDQDDVRAALALDLDRDGFDEIVAVTGGDHLLLWRDSLVPGDGDRDGVDDASEVRGGSDCNDADSDDDTVLDGSDDCPLLADPLQGDQDGDGVGDLCDNCAARQNADQLDDDGDGIGDACERAAFTTTVSPITGATSQAALTLVNVSVTGSDTKTSTVLPASSISLSITPVTNKLTVDAVHLSGSSVQFFPVLKIILADLAVTSTGRSSVVTLDPATSEFFVELPVVVTGTAGGTVLHQDGSLALSGVLTLLPDGPGGMPRIELLHLSGSLTSLPFSYPPFSFALTGAYTMDLRTP